MIVAVFLKNAAAGCLSFSCRLHVFVFDVIVCKITENLPKPLFFLEKQFVFTEKTICFHEKNNLFSMEKQLVFTGKTICFCCENKTKTIWSTIQLVAELCVLCLQTTEKKTASHFSFARKWLAAVLLL